MLVPIIIIQIITFVLIIIFLRLLFHKHLSFALNRLQGLQTHNLEKEAQLNKELERAKRERQEEAEKGRFEARKLKEAAKQEADRVKEEALIEAQETSRRIQQEAQAECERIKKATIAEVQESSVTLAAKVIKEIFSEENCKELQRELVDELINELRKVDKEKIKVEVKKAEVVSSYPLSDKQKHALSEILKEAIGHSIELTERLDPAIISGLVINLGGRILDGSLQNKLRKVIPLLKKEQEAKGDVSH
ncbi:MAG: hypothetical protein DRP74_06840 [Candidatus Omnitrophota bacterium]|nr:MAG: hypothetical protein DRP74_06840 [Candidatus Omnitrophota bacterium]